jgi:hypothetical protein
MPPTLPPINYNPIGGEVPPPRNEPPPVGGQYPEFGPRADGYVQHPAFLQGRAEGSTGVVGGQTQDIANWYTQAGAGVGQGEADLNRPAPNSPAQPPAGDPMAGPGNDQVVSQWQATLDKNRALNEKATVAGDDKEMKRLDDEWARLTSTPLYKQMYGGADAMEVKNRLINSYMQPDNEAAEPSFERAHARMVTDDWWAEEMTKAGAWGDQAQNDRLWAEHWHAMNKGGRDPLEGHPQAIQNLEAKKEELKRMNQQSAYDMLQQWQTKSGNL